MYAGLLAAHAGDRALLADVLRGMRDNTVVRDFPTVGQLHAVLLAEQDRLAGNVDAALLPGGTLRATARVSAWGEQGDSHRAEIEVRTRSAGEILA